MDFDCSFCTFYVLLFIVFIFIYVCVRIYARCVCALLEARRELQVLWTGITGILCLMWMLGMELGSSAEQ